MSLGLDLGAECGAGERTCAAAAVSASAGAGAASSGAAANSASSETWSPTFLFFGSCTGFDARAERLSIGTAPSAAAGGCPSAAGAGASPSSSAGSSAARLFLGGMVTYTRFANSSPPDYTLAEKRRRPPTYTLERQPPRKLRVYFSALRSRREWAISFFRHL